jgi:4-amino-4-deoxy-L-arabinose transferase-like glycosyltransferase
MKISRPFLVLCGILVLAFALRMFRLDFFSLRGDESFTVLFVQKPLAQMWYETLTVEPNPPLLYFLLRGWIALAGAGEFATRFFSAFFGVLCVPLVYRLAHEILTLAPTLSLERRRSIGLLAAFIIAINPYQIWHSQDVRNYTLWPALSLLALIFFWQWYSNTRTRPPERPSQRLQGAMLLFIPAELAALYAHYYEAFVLLALNLFVFATTWRDLKKLAQWIGAQIFLALLYLPYPLLLSNRVAAYGEGSGRQGVALWDIARETFSAFAMGDTQSAEWRAWLWIPFALLALTGLIFSFARDGKRGLFFVLYAGVPTLAVFALNTVRPLYLERYLNGIAPAYYLLMAFGIVAFAAFLRRHVTGSLARFAPPAFRGLAVATLALVAFVALANYWNNPAFAKSPDWRGLTQIINADAQPGDIIVQNFPEMSLLYYDRTRLPLVVYPETYLPDNKTTQQLNAMNANYQRVWFIPAADDYWDPDQFVETFLDRRDDLLQETRVGDFRLRLYATPSQYLNTMRKLNANFGDTLTLLGYRLDLEMSLPTLVLYWRAQKTPARDYRVRLRLFDASKHVYETRTVPVRGTSPISEWRKNQIIVDQQELPLDVRQRRELRLSVCDPNATNCLPIQSAQGQTDGTELWIPLQP